MLNNAKLKETLSLKATTISAVPDKSVTTRMLQSDLPASSATPVCINLSIQLTGQHSEKFLSHLQALFDSLSPACNRDSEQSSSHIVKNDSTVKCEAKLSALPSVNPPVATKGEVATEKQRTMMRSLISRKRISADKFEALMMQQVGHLREVNLTKREASMLIDSLLHL